MNPQLNTANLITISRILMIPLILGVYVCMQGGGESASQIAQGVAQAGQGVAQAGQGVAQAGQRVALDGLVTSNWLAALLFIIASLSDWLDGYLARRLGQTSDFGAFLDPVADKLLVVCVLILLTSAHAALLLPAVIIIAREITVSALREWTASRRARIAVAFSGKIKTAVQMTAISTLLLVPLNNTPRVPFPSFPTFPSLSSLPSSLPSFPIADTLWYLGYHLLLLSALLSIISLLQYLLTSPPKP